ncbi:cyclase family protein [Roseovarius amoyensis]|uniref:cyclase family protein n=1 Tax=Roseovarius amoyensis TaxID=2211448 RepID=UPI0013A6AFC0|nr:cyclase family protein [Roseovarius amoyensis]
MTGFRTALILCLCLAGPASAQDAPSRFGVQDRIGASVMMTESNAIQAANIIQRGRVVSLGRDYRSDMPQTPGQDLRLTQIRVRHGDTARIDSQIDGLTAHSGTRLVGLGHIGAADGDGGPIRFYNGLTAEDDIPGELGVERVAPFFTRGILIDIVSLRGGPMAAGDEITVADIETALDWFGIDPPGNGDAVILHTGWGQHWIADNDTYLSGSPGLGHEAAQWLVEQDVALIGIDSWNVEALTPDAPAGAQPVHVRLITDSGVFVHENLETERLIDAEIAEFAYIFAPVPIVGATGSIGAPLAVY